MKQSKRVKKTGSVVMLSALAAVSLLPAHVYAMTTPPCVQTAITISVTNSLDFVTIEPCLGTAGTVIINKTNGARSTSGCITGTTGTASRAGVSVRGNNDAGRTIQVTITNPNTANVTVTGGGTDTMSVTGIGMKQGTPTYSFAGNFTKTVDVGGTINVGANEPGGTYTGTFTINATCI